MEKKIKSFITSRIEKGYFSGSQVGVSYRGETICDLALGSRNFVPGENSGQVDGETMFNLESITKVMVTLPLAFWLIQEGRLNLEDRVVDYIPAFGTSEEKKKVTVRDMLNFTGGIPLEDPPGAEEAALKGDLDKAWELHFSQGLTCSPGSRVFYSDVSCRIFGRLLETILGTDLGTAAKDLFFEPLGMKNTTFKPVSSEKCVSTGRSEKGRDLRGELTQDLEHYMGEVLGSDGIFSTASDMMLFSRMLLNGGILNGKRVLGDITVEKMIGEISNLDTFEDPGSYLHYILSGPKAWFWEYGSSPWSFFGDLVSEKAVGKMGGAGTFLLVDPAYDLVIAYLTNYGQPEKTLAGDSGWNKFQSEINMMGLCNLVIGNLPC